MPALKDIAKSLLKSAGFELRNRAYYHVDAFADQKMLLSGEATVIFDVGANDGRTAREYRQVFPRAVIHCFEPGDEPYRTLSSAFGGDNSVKVHKLAVADEVGTRRYYMNRASVTNSLLPLDPESHRYMVPSDTENLGYTDVETTRLDEFCASQGIDRISILKLDIQGSELMALKGAAGLLGRGAIDLVYSEVLFGRFYEGQASFDELWSYLKQQGYVLYGLYNLIRGTDGMLGYGDAIFMSPAIESKLPRPHGQRG